MLGQAMGGTEMTRLVGDLDRRRTSFDRVRVSQWIMIFALALSLSACGKSGTPEPPDPKTDHYPRQYPDPSSL